MKVISFRAHRSPACRIATWRAERQRRGALGADRSRLECATTDTCRRSYVGFWKHPTRRVHVSSGRYSKLVAGLHKCST